MPQKEPRARTSEANSIKGAGVSGVPNATASRWSPRLPPVVDDRRPGAAAIPRRRSPRLLSLVEGRGGGAGPADGVAATPRRGPPRLPSQGESRGGHAGPPGSREGKEKNQRGTSPSARSRRRSPKIPGLSRSPRLSKSAADPGGGARPDATGGGDPEGGGRRRSARLMCSVGKGSVVEIGNGTVSDETGRSLGRGSEGKNKKKKKKEVSVGDLNVFKGKKKGEISVVSATKGGRDTKRRQTMETQEELASQRGCLESGSDCLGWTSEQDMALHRAYILAKPSPHFWKKVAKLVPGKSAQECFDKMHSKIVTPVPMQPRSRAKAIGHSPLDFSDLFKKDAKRPRSSKREGLLAHKTVRHILRKHSIMDQGQEADLFSVLETSPNLHAEFSQIKIASISEYIAQSPELLQRSNENLSSSHKRMLSRFKSQIQANYASPAVLKPVRNIALHEKYIDELHCRDARRSMYAKAACSVGSKDDEEIAVVKGDVVKAAKNSLVSEARRIVCQFGHTQSSHSSNSDYTDGSEDECEEDT